MKRFVFVFVSLAALSLLTGACSNESSQTQPVIDTVAPNPPVGFQAEDQGNMVRITWEQNAESDLAGYRLYRSSYESGPFGCVNSEPLLCPWYYDQVLPAAMTYYRVTAIDESGNESAFSQVIGVYSRKHSRGRSETTTSG
jgi:fibronectin type 3 domain-containing protein